MIKHFNLHRTVLYNWIFLAAVIIYTVTAYNSHGYYGTDEQFHIIEFAKIKLGINQVADMPWGYSEQFRSTLQPVICLFLMKLSAGLGITDPYAFGFILRLLTAFIALTTIHFFIKYTDHLIQNNKVKVAYYLLSYFIWFIPFMSVRFSSETWAGLFFLNAFVIYHHPKLKKRKFFLTGCMLGLSFLFRFQMTFAALGFVMWLVLIDKSTFKQLLNLISGSCIVLLIGNVMDCWFYENKVITIWNYFYAFYDNTANLDSARFGTSPWYTYIEQLFRLPGYFLGASFIVSILILIITRPKNIFIWCFLPFFIIHSCIPHKEERFIFPLVYLLSIIMVLAYERINSFLNKPFLSSINYVIIIALVILNSIGLIIVSTCSAGNGKMVIVKYIHDEFGKAPVNLIQSNWGDIYDKHGGIIPFQEKQVNMRSIDNLCDLTDSLLAPNEENILVVQKRSLLLKSCSSSIASNHFVMKKQSLPVWVEWLNDNLYNGFDKLDVYVLYKKEH